MKSITLDPIMGMCYSFYVRIISRKRLKEFWNKHTDSEKPLRAWFADVKNAVWKNSMDIKSVYRNASFLNENRVVFNIKGNKYRLITVINYNFGIVYIRFIGAHKNYDKIDAHKV